MTPLLFIFAALAGGAGAALRYLADLGVAKLARRRFPWGILVVNVTGSFALGLVAGLAPAALFVVGAGLLGGYTTFSTAMFDTVALWRNGERPAATANLLGTFVLSVIAALAGLLLGSAF